MSFLYDPHFWAGWLRIVLIDILLAGDNAVIIALAVRTLPPREQLRGRLYGSFGAVLLRIVFIAVISLVLRVPFVRLVGGMFLLWIAIKLIRVDPIEEGKVRAGTTLRQAIGIIVLADVVMSLDNVIAIAAAARGDLTLVIFGLLFSLPLVVWGSGLLSLLMNRWPVIIWLGGGVLGWLAVKMIGDDPVMLRTLGSSNIETISRYGPLGIATIIFVFGWIYSRRQRPAAAADAVPHAAGADAITRAGQTVHRNLMKTPHLLFALAAAVLPDPAFAEEPATPDSILRSEFIFESAPFASCHATTIVETGDGLTAAWFGGSAEGKPDVGIWLSREEHGVWTAPEEVASSTQPDGSREPCWNPVLFQPSHGPLLLFYKVGPSPQRWWGMLRTSTDQGRTWSAGRRLPDGILGPIKNKPVELPGGDLLCSSSTESVEPKSRWQVHFERSTDLGISWTRTPDLNDGLEISAIQPSVLLLGGDHLRALGRTRQSRLFAMDSSDAGATWQQMKLLDLPNPNSGTDAITLRDGRHALIYNHTAKGRTPLNLAISRDGTAWQAALIVESGAGEFSYPAIVQSRDGNLHITYTWKRKTVKHVVIDTAKLVLTPIVDGEWPR